MPGTTSELWVPMQASPVKESENKTPLQTGDSTPDHASVCGGSKVLRSASPERLRRPCSKWKGEESRSVNIAWDQCVGAGEWKTSVREKEETPVKKE